MYLSRHQSIGGPRWALDGLFLPQSFTLNLLLDLPSDLQPDLLKAVVTQEIASGPALPPIEQYQEVWASGVTYLRSREARQAESSTGDIYQRVYTAQRPELFYKSVGWRVIGPDKNIRIRPDSKWNVPEPELVLVLNRFGEICGYTGGNDVSSRSIVGENPLFLPQAKVYNGSCSLGPSIKILSGAELIEPIPIQLHITRKGEQVFAGQTSTTQMKRPFSELARYLFGELDFPFGAFLMTGTGIVPPETYSLQPDDVVRVSIGDLVLENTSA